MLIRNELWLKKKMQKSLCPDLIMDAAISQPVGTQQMTLEVQK